MSKLAVTVAKTSDAIALEALLDAAAAWQQSQGIDQWRPGQFPEEIRLTIANGDLYVARLEGVIVGCFMLEGEVSPLMTRWLIERNRVPAEGAHLGRLAVARESTGRGLGVELLNVACALAAQRGFAYVCLDCPSQNARLRRYYLETGFSYCGDVSTRGPNGEHRVSSVFERQTG
jgi:protein-tyrosine phosphatase